MHRLEQLEDRRMFAGYAAANVAELIAAVNAANASAEADTIALAAGATFSLNAVDNTTNGATGLPVVAAGGGALTIVGGGAVIERSAASGTRAFRLLDVAPGASLTLADLTLQNGLADSRLGPYVNGVYTSLPAQGGAIFNRGALTLDGVTVQNNVARGYGAGWGVIAAGDAAGGGVYSAGTLTINGGVIRGNGAIGGHGESAGLIYADMGGRYVPASDGVHGFGGGVFVAGGSAAVSGTVITANTAAGGDGGRGSGYGITRYGGDGGNGSGGGLYAAGGANVTLRNVTVSFNTARGGIGGADGSGEGHRRYTGLPGQGIGGGIHVVRATAGLDDYTVSHVLNNTASTSSPNIAGSYRRLS